MAKEKAELIALKVMCPVADKTVTILVQDLEWETDSGECELCGSHGSVDVSFKCGGCGKNHRINLKSW